MLQAHENQERMGTGARGVGVRPEPRPEAEQQEPMLDHKARQQVLEKIRILAATIEEQGRTQEAKRQPIEDRWLEDLYAYHGRYTPEVEAQLKDEKKSRLYLNHTRTKTNAWEARLSDMLFPTDDKNWGINPSPVPELANTIERADAESPEYKQATDIQAESKKRSKAMEREIEDQLEACDHNAECRDVIHNGCKLGTGVLKGPILSDRVRRSWIMKEGEWLLAEVSENKPVTENVDPWNYFPDMSTAKVSQCEKFWERHLYSARQIRDLAMRPGFIPSEIQALLQNGPDRGTPNYISKLRGITGENSDATEKRFQVWEYNGTLERDELESLCLCFDDRDLFDIVAEEEDLTTFHAVIWSCQGYVLKFGIHQLDSADPIYSVFNLEKDETSQFGFGVPYLIRNSQASMNAGWRMLMNNSAISTGPQIVVNRKSVTPLDGTWDLYPMKIWDDTGESEREPFRAYNIPGHQQEIANIIALSEEHMDKESALPLVAQGEKGAHQTDTAGGMAMMMNSVNVVFRRVVKNYDDDISTPTIRRFYDWNMQFNPKQDIKGDYEVKARGSSVLLVRELQAQNLMAMAMQFTNHPVLGPMTKALPLYRRLVQAHMLPADEIVTTDDEFQAWQKEQSEKPQTDPRLAIEMARLQNDLKKHESEMRVKLQIADMTYTTAMMKLATEQNISLEQIQGALQQAREGFQHKERQMAAEIGAQRNTPEETGGGGGYV